MKYFFNFKIILMLSMIALALLPANADGQFSIVPTGRLYIDAATFFNSDREDFSDAVTIPDVWLGTRMNYKKWNAAVNMSFNNGKIGLRAVYVGYSFRDDFLLRIGSFVPQYGLRTTLVSTNLAPMVSPTANSAFYDGRQLGGMLVYYPEKYLMALGVHSEGDAVKSMSEAKDFVKEGIGISGRFAFRPFHEAGKVLQVGLSGGVSSPRKYLEEDGKTAVGIFNYKTNFPTRVKLVNALNASVDHAERKWKFSPELLLNYKFLALESQYYYSRVDRTAGFPVFAGQGAYVILRGLLRGNSYSYYGYGGVLDTPDPKSWELVADYDYTYLSDARSGIRGGKANNFSLTLNYYINRYVIARLRYGHTHTWDRADRDPVTLNSLMARIQVIF